MMTLLAGMICRGNRPWRLELGQGLFRPFTHLGPRILRKIIGVNPRQNERIVRPKRRQSDFSSQPNHTISSLQNGQQTLIISAIRVTHDPGAYINTYRSEKTKRLVNLPLLLLSTEITQPKVVIPVRTHVHPMALQGFD